jgi:hypothetical protein
MKVPKQKCENCPARNRRVATVIVKRTEAQMTLCLYCRAILDKLEREYIEAQKRKGLEAAA